MNETTKFVLNVLAVVVIAAAAVRLLFMDTLIVEDNGMAPTLVQGDEVLIWKGASVDMADVVACEHPFRDGELVISRAIAFAGHTVHTDHFGTLYVDEDRTTNQSEGRVRFYDVTHKRQWDMALRTIDYFGHHSHQYMIEHGTEFSLLPTRIEKGVYLLGDNRSETSYDSRAFGEVDPERCIGQVILRLKPGPSRDDDVKTGYLELIR
jgi:signal peptidase I